MWSSCSLSLSWAISNFCYCCFGSISCFCWCWYCLTWSWIFQFDWLIFVISFVYPNHPSFISAFCDSFAVVGLCFINFAEFLSKSATQLSLLRYKSTLFWIILLILVVGYFVFCNYLITINKSIIIMCLLIFYCVLSRFFFPLHFISLIMLLLVAL